MKICEKKGHKFEPRYDETESKEPITIDKMTAREARTLFYYNTYVHDICVRCGKIIKKEAKGGIS